MIVFVAVLTQRFPGWACSSVKTPLGSLPQLSRHAVLGDGQGGLGSHEVVAGVVAMSAHLTQDAGRAHAAGGHRNDVGNTKAECKR